jgi:hypothetical protein
MLLATVRWERKRCPAWAVALVAGVAVLFKVTNIVGVAACVIYAVIRRVQTRRAPSVDDEPRIATAVGSRGVELQTTAPPQLRQPRIGMRRLVTFIVAVIAAVVVVELAWMLVSHAIEKFPANDLPSTTIYQVHTFPWERFWDSFGAAVTPLQRPYVAPTLNTHLVRGGWHIVNTLILVGVVIGAVWAGARSRLRALGGATLVAMVATGPLFSVVNYFFQNGMSYPPGIAPRYGLSVIPAAVVVCTVPLARSVWLRLGTSVFVVYLTVGTLVALLNN